VNTPYFITCSLESLTYPRGIEVANSPVNLFWCKSIKKGRYRCYPDNEGLPSIIFKGCDVEWVYKSEEMRDEEYSRIVRNEVKPNDRSG
jgi:hypothetical protein